MEREFLITVGNKEIKALYYSVTEALRMWPGAPQRPREEQEVLRELRSHLFAMTMELLIEEPED